ncbi:hypothetical protein CEUSTIGMA_g6409.t1 [Chlamydomonas eustigma]|uniref:N-acetyltransferase domain-containing protein n=1 Tax=Chlamydomonas eustigma TaxID=1157962 RepID=A0A250X7S3_9CHLO|nr:hypothetical protein CEUSTIGMA_g6409.t1 [Chlamydomonas eustigma]|eukprot:GAX78969.1 hypothetical protein CEUSTIGMA_g6409.t1 [Chlamydomonas eustigma]
MATAGDLISTVPGNLHDQCQYCCKDDYAEAKDGIPFPRTLVYCSCCCSKCTHVECHQKEVDDKEDDEFAREEGMWFCSMVHQELDKRQGLRDELWSRPSDNDKKQYKQEDQAAVGPRIVYSIEICKWKADCPASSRTVDSVFKILNSAFSNFRVAVLRKGGVVVSVATLRVFGTLFAELPFVATKEGFRKDGHCRRLISYVEAMLIELGVCHLVVPSVNSVLPMWSKFGYRPITEEELRALEGDIVSVDLETSTFVTKRLLKALPPHRAPASSAAVSGGGGDVLKVLGVGEGPRSRLRRKEQQEALKKEALERKQQKKVVVVANKQGCRKIKAEFHDGERPAPVRNLAVNNKRSRNQSVQPGGKEGVKNSCESISSTDDSSTSREDSSSSNSSTSGSSASDSQERDRCEGRPSTSSGRKKQQQARQQPFIGAAMTNKDKRRKTVCRARQDLQPPQLQDHHFDLGSREQVKTGRGRPEAAAEVAASEVQDASGRSRGAEIKLTAVTGSQGLKAVRDRLLSEIDTLKSVSIQKSPTWSPLNKNSPCQQSPEAQPLSFTPEVQPGGLPLLTSPEAESLPLPTPEGHLLPPSPEVQLPLPYSFEVQPLPLTTPAVQQLIPAITAPDVDCDTLLFKMPRPAEFSTSTIWEHNLGIYTSEITNINSPSAVTTQATLRLPKSCHLRAATCFSKTKSETNSSKGNVLSAISAGDSRHETTLLVHPDELVANSSKGNVLSVISSGGDSGHETTLLVHPDELAANSSKGNVLSVISSGGDSGHETTLLVHLVHPDELAAKSAEDSLPLMPARKCKAETVVDYYVSITAEHTASQRLKPSVLLASPQANYSSVITHTIMSDCADTATEHLVTDTAITEHLVTDTAKSASSSYSAAAYLVMKGSSLYYNNYDKTAVTISQLLEISEMEVPQPPSPSVLGAVTASDDVAGAKIEDNDRRRLMQMQSLYNEMHHDDAVIACGIVSMNDSKASTTGLQANNVHSYLADMGMMMGAAPGLEVQALRSSAVMSTACNVNGKTSKATYKQLSQQAVQSAEIQVEEQLLDDKLTQPPLAQVQAGTDVLHFNPVNKPLLCQPQIQCTTVKTDPGHQSENYHVGEKYPSLIKKSWDASIIHGIPSHPQQAGERPTLPLQPSSKHDQKQTSVISTEFQDDPVESPQLASPGSTARFWSECLLKVLPAVTRVLLDTPSASDDVDSSSEGRLSVDYTQGMQSVADGLHNGQDAVDEQASISKSANTTTTASHPVAAGSLLLSKESNDEEYLETLMPCRAVESEVPGTKLKRETSDQGFTFSCSKVKEAENSTGIKGSPTKGLQHSSGYRGHICDGSGFNKDNALRYGEESRQVEEEPSPDDVKQALEVIASHIFDSLSQ